MITTFFVYFLGLRTVRQLVDLFRSSAIITNTQIGTIKQGIQFLDQYSSQPWANGASHSLQSVVDRSNLLKLPLCLYSIWPLEDFVGAYSSPSYTSNLEKLCVLYPLVTTTINLPPIVVESQCRYCNENSFTSPFALALHIKVCGALQVRHRHFIILVIH